jgi:hypothetical protein
MNPSDLLAILFSFVAIGIMLTYAACTTHLICKPKIVVPNINISNCYLPITAHRESYPCGAIATQAILEFYSINKTAAELKRAIAGDGRSYLKSMCDYLDNIGFNTDCSSKYTSDLKKIVCEEHLPVIAIIVVDGAPWTSGFIPGFTDPHHAIVVKGLNDSFIFLTDAFGEHNITIERFERMWGNAGNMAIIPRPPSS